MTSRKITSLQVLVTVLVTMLRARTMAQPSDCTSVLISMAPCLNYVTGNSPNPSASCCSQLANVVQTQPRCLCAALNGSGSSLGVSINRTLALALPALCNVKTPPVSKCNAADGPATAISPSVSPSGSPQGLPVNSDDIPTSSSTSGAGGSKTVPAATFNDVIFKMPLQLILFLLAIALYASTSSYY